MGIPVVLRLIEDWHAIVDMISELVDVPAVLIRRCEEGTIEVLVSSTNSKEYFQVGESRELPDSGLFCEWVYTNRNELLVQNARSDDQWSNCSDLELGFVSYLGYPIMTPSGEVYGTICLMDKRENSFSDLHRKLLSQCKSVVENHLRLFDKKQNLEKKLSNSEQLQGMVPMCTSCHRMRTDTTHWSQVDEVLSQYSDAFFPKCLCPDCTSLITAQLEQSGSPISKFERLLTEYIRAFGADAAYLVLVDGDDIEPIVGCVNKVPNQAIDEQMCKSVVSTGARSTLSNQDEKGNTIYSYCQPLLVDEEIVGVIYSRGNNEKLLDSATSSFLNYAFTNLAEDFLCLAKTRSTLLSAASMRVGREVIISNTQKAVFGSSEATTNLLNSLEAAARQRVTVLLTGETGTGKEIAARTIHNLSQENDSPFIALNCSAIPRDLIEAELFGVEAGAFTGAQKSRSGRFEQANGGTLFLDEIGELSHDIQVTLLRVLEERSVCRLGSSKSIHVDFRLVAATNSDLETLVASGDFRQDLYFRLNVFRIEVPPLRMRRDDIISLASHYLEASKERLGKSINGFSTEAEQFLLQYEWPGNIRELRNVIERAVVVSQGNHIERADLNVSPAKLVSSAILLPTELPSRYDDAKEVFEKIYIERALERCGPTRSERALSKLTGLARTTLRRKLEKFGLHEEFLKPK